MKLSKEERQKVEQALSRPWGRAVLKCDGYEVALDVQKVRELSYRVVTYVNGEWRGAWISGSQQHPEQKFLRRSERALLTPTAKAEMVKILGKRAAVKDPLWTKKIVMFYLDWASGKQALAHLLKVCESVELVEAS